jgi:hypothetical protein
MGSQVGDIRSLDISQDEIGSCIATGSTSMLLV